MEIAKLFNALPSAGSQGVIWGIMAIGVYITYRILDVADLTVDGSIATGGAVAAVLIIGGCNVWVAMVAAFLVGMLAGLATGIFHTFMGIPAILAGILTQLSLYSINLRILGGKANMAVSVNNYPLLVSARNARVLSLSNPIFILAALAVAVIALLYWFFGTERGCSLRATGANANMARAQGINTNADKVLGLMLSNGLVAFSGALLTQYQGFVDVGMGRGAIVIGLAAVIISDVIFGRLFTNFALKLVAVVFGAVFASVLALMKMSKIPPLRWLSTIYIEIIRGTPMLLQLYFFYFGLPILIPALTKQKFLCIAIALICNSAAYVSEVIRSGIQAVDPGQKEAALSLGFSESRAMWFVVVPQAVKNILPALGNEFIMIVKDTSLGSTFFIGDLMTQYLVVKGPTYLPIEPLVIVGIIYFLMTFILSKVFGHFERKLKRADRHSGYERRHKQQREVQI